MLKSKESTLTGIFLVRYYGNAHLGKRSFELAEQLAECVVKVLSVKMIKARESMRWLSQSAISTVYDSQEEIGPEAEGDDEASEDGATQDGK